MALDGGKGGGSKIPSDLERLIKSMQGGGGGGRSQYGLQGEVFMGRRNKKVRARGYGDHYRTVKVPTTMSAHEAYLDFFKWGEKKKKDFIAQATLGGLMKQGQGIVEASGIWKDLVSQAAIYNDAGQKVTPWDIMSTYVKSAGGEDAWVKQGDWEVNTITGERRYVGPQFKTTTDERVDLTDPRTAQAIATQVFQNAMGRNPGQGEMQKFAKALMAAEKANPVTTTTTTEFDMTTGEAIGTESTQQGGLSAEARAMIGANQAKKDPEYGAYQAATTYYGALEQAVYGSPG